MQEGESSEVALEIYFAIHNNYSIRIEYAIELKHSPRRSSPCPTDRKPSTSAW